MGLSASAIKMGKAFIEIGVLDKTARGLTAISAKLRAVGAGVSNIGRKMLLGAGAVAVPLFLSARAFAEFDDKMRSVGAKSQASAVQLKMLTDQARKLGRETSHTATEVGTLQEVLARANFSPDQIIAATPGIRDFARATGTDVESAASSIAETLKQFSLGASEASRVADIMTTTANGTLASVEDLSEAMKFVGSIATEFPDMSPEKAFALIGFLRDVGIQGSMGGTSLRRLMLATPKLKKELENSFNIKVPSSLPLIGMLNLLQEKTKDMDLDEKLILWEKLFMKLGITSALKIGKGQDNINELLKKNMAGGGISKKQSELMDAGLGGTLRRLWSAFNGVGIAIGNVMGIESGGFLQMLTAGLIGLEGWIDANQGIVGSMIQLVPLLIGAGISLMAFGSGLSFLGVGIGVIGSIITAVMTTVAFLVAGGWFPALIVLGALVQASIAAIGVSILAFLSAISLGVIQYFTGIFDPLIKSVQDTYTEIVESIGAIGNALFAGDVVLAAKIAGRQIFLAFYDAFQLIYSSFIYVMDLMRNSTGQLVGWLAEVLATMVEVQGAITGTIFDADYIRSLGDYNSYVDAGQGQVDYMINNTDDLRADLASMVAEAQTAADNEDQRQVDMITEQLAGKKEDDDDKDMTISPMVTSAADKIVEAVAKTNDNTSPVAMAVKELPEVLLKGTAAAQAAIYKAEQLVNEKNALALQQQANDKLDEINDNIVELAIEGV